MTNRIRGADLLARTLAGAGVRHLFTLSGNHVMPVFDAALDANLSLVHVRHEAAAVHMADAWGRLTGLPGIALITGGPGHANAVSALYTALAAESPLVLISGHAPLNELGKGAFQEMRQADIAAPLTKASWTAQSAQTLGTDVARALRLARSGRPGPVHLSVPNDVLDATVDVPLPSKKELLAKERTPGEGTVDSFFENSKRPLIITGPAGMKLVRGLEESLGVPVIGMESPRGVKDPSLGRLAEVLAKADAVLLLGKRRDFTLRFGRAFAPECRVLEFEYGVDLSLRKSLPKSGWLEEVRAALRYRPPEWATVRSKPEGLVHPVELCRYVQEFLNEKDAVLVCDGGEFGQWAQACASAPHRVI